MENFKKRVPFKMISSDVQYVDNVITGTATMKKNITRKRSESYMEAASKIKETVDISFKINCH